MEKKRVLIVGALVVAVALALAIGCCVFVLGQGGSIGFLESELNVSDPERPAEPGGYDSQQGDNSEFVMGTDTGGIPDKGMNSGSSSGKDNNLSSNSGKDNNNSGNSNQTAPPQPESGKPADDGTTTKGVTYSQYQAMSAAEQQEWFESFSSVEAFFAWYNEAKAVHDANDDSIIIDGNTNIDMNEIAKEQS